MTYPGELRDLQLLMLRMHLLQLLAPQVRGHLLPLSDSCSWSISTHTGAPSSYRLVLGALTLVLYRE